MLGLELVLNAREYQEEIPNTSDICVEALEFSIFEFVMRSLVLYMYLASFLMLLSSFSSVALAAPLDLSLLNGAIQSTVVQSYNTYDSDHDDSQARRHFVG